MEEIKEEEATEVVESVEETPVDPEDIGEVPVVADPEHSAPAEEVAE